MQISHSCSYLTRNRAKKPLLSLIFASVLLSFTSQANAQGPGYPNVQQTAGQFLSGPIEVNQGRTSLIIPHQGFILTIPQVSPSAAGSDLKARVIDISNPRQPRLVRILNGVGSGFSTHAYTYEKNTIAGLLGGHATFNAAGELINVSSQFPPMGWNVGAGRGLVQVPWATNMIWKEYGSRSNTLPFGKGTTKFIDFDHNALGQGIGSHPTLLGNLLIFFADHGTSGIVVYDISPMLDTPARQPRVVALTKMNVTGYWPELWGDRNSLKALFSRDVRRVQVADMTNLQDMRIVFDRTFNDPGTFVEYSQFQDEFGFTERYKINMRTLEGGAVIRPHENGMSVSQFTVPVGNLILTGGLGNKTGGDRQGMAIWAHQSAPDLKGPTVGYHVPRPNQTNYHTKAPLGFLIHETLRSETILNGSAFTCRAVSSGGLGSPVAGRLTHSFNDVLTFTPDEPLARDTTYEVTFFPGVIKDAVGNGIEGYSFRFSTGASVTQGTTPPPATPVPSTPTPTSTPTPRPTSTPTPRPTESPTPVATSTPVVVASPQPTANNTPVTVTTPRPQATLSPEAKRARLIQLIRLLLALFGQSRSSKGEISVNATAKRALKSSVTNLTAGDVKSARRSLRRVVTTMPVVCNTTIRESSRPLCNKIVSSLSRLVP
jgi:Bacterial Ig-like domain